jgi:hypothetical protein
VVDVLHQQYLWHCRCHAGVWQRFTSSNWQHGRMCSGAVSFTAAGCRRHAFCTVVTVRCLHPRQPVLCDSMEQQDSETSGCKCASACTAAQLCCAVVWFLGTSRQLVALCQRSAILTARVAAREAGCCVDKQRHRHWMTFFWGCAGPSGPARGLCRCAAQLVQPLRGCVLHGAHYFHADGANQCRWCEPVLGMAMECTPSF